MSSVGKRILIIAGPNGAGKTTFAREYLAREGTLQIFLNADLVAAGISPLDPDAEAIRAGRIMLELEDYHAANDHSFAIETTLSGKSYAPRIKTWQQLGYRVDLIYIALPS